MLLCCHVTKRDVHIVKYGKLNSERVFSPEPQAEITGTKRITLLAKIAVRLTVDYRKKEKQASFLEELKHLADTPLLLFHIGVNIEIESRGNVGMTEQHAYSFIVTVAFNATCGETMT